MIQLGAHTSWTKSSYSTGTGACVEVRSTEATAVGVTDSKVDDSPARPVMSVSPAAFTALIESVRV